MAALLPPSKAVAAIRRYVRLHEGRLGSDPARASVPLDGGELLLMPSEGREFAGVKVLSVRESGSTNGVPRIQGTYVLFDRGTLTPIALLDGPELTAMRTAAVSFAVVGDRVLAHPGTLKVAVFGSGPQGFAHVDTLVDLSALSRPSPEITFLSRQPKGPILEGRAGQWTGDVVAIGSVRAAEVLRSADLVICATSSARPLFASSMIQDDAIVVAVGSHTPDARELEGALLRRSTVVVEDRVTALREAGDVVMAIEEKMLDASSLIAMGDVLSTTEPFSPRGPLVFKSTGMAWQDLALAGEIYKQRKDSRPLAADASNVGSH